MNVEKEIKLRLTPEKKAKLILFLDKECLFKGELEQEDIYYNHPCRDFSITDEAVRLRIEKGLSHTRIYLTYKGPRLMDKVKTREEVNIVMDLSMRENVSLFLEKNGFVKVAVVRKKRRVYKCGSLEYSIDDVDNLGSYLEIEVKGENYPDLLELAREFGLEDMMVEKTYLELILEKEGGG